MFLEIYHLSFVLVFCAAQYEGESCTHDGILGTCVDISRCTSAIEGLKKRQHPKICSYDQAIPIVCCLDAEFRGTTTDYTRVITTTKRSSISSTTMYIPPVYEYEYLNARSTECEPIPATTANKTGQKAFDKCIEYQEKYVYPCGRVVSFLPDASRSNKCHHNADDLIFGGVEVSEHEFPHMVMLRYGDGEEYQHWLCGGTVISERYVLTAAHCTATTDRIPVSHVIVGALTLKDAANKLNRYKVKSIIKHPGFRPSFKYHDIALLETLTTIKLSQYVVPACLHVGDPVDDERVLATGWGLTTKNGGISDVMRKVILHKFAPEECAHSYQPHRLMYRGLDPFTQLCYGHKHESKDTCKGDSGGPIQIKSKRIHCMYVVIGVTSIGVGCGFHEPALYTKVEHYVPWIESIVWP